MPVRTRASRPKRAASRTQREATRRSVPALLLVGMERGAALAEALQARGWTASHVPSQRAAIAAMAAPARTATRRARDAKPLPDIALVPEQATPRATLALLRRLVRVAPTQRRVLLLRGKASAAHVDYTNQGGADYLLTPPATPDRVVRAVRAVWGRQEQERLAMLEYSRPGSALRELRTLMEQRAQELSRANRDLRQALREIARKNKALRTLNESLRVQSTTDALTGLFNRREFLNRIRTEWGRFRRYGRPLSLIMLDIDHFKRINDTYGHECGDVVLRDLGRLIGGNKRAQDLCCRYGGEEFVVLLTETSLQAAFKVADELRRRIAAFPFHYVEQPIAVRVSLGVCGAAEQAPADVEAFINLADKAMYRAKDEGRDRTVVLDPADETRILWESAGSPTPAAAKRRRRTAGGRAPRRKASGTGR